MHASVSTIPSHRRKSGTRKTPYHQQSVGRPLVFLLPGVAVVIHATTMKRKTPVAVKLYERERKTM